MLGAVFIYKVYLLTAQQFAGQFVRGDFAVAHRVAVAPEHILRRRRDTLGVVAPRTAQRTPFQEDRGTDTRPVVYGELFDTENDAFLHGAVRSFLQI